MSGGKCPDTPIPPNLGGGVFTRQISGVGFQKYRESSAFGNPPPKFRGQISPNEFGGHGGIVARQGGGWGYTFFCPKGRVCKLPDDGGDNDNNGNATMTHWGQAE